ncbi:MAG: hypothetical protein K5927_04005 [Lachnospiraceae bacterium]|nr:hypothetical protein [Lachnospiraceae bacterium]
MAKNIIVTDENGNIIGSTYPKRAKGLVTKGRARLVDERTICMIEKGAAEIRFQEDIYNMCTINFNARDWKKDTEPAGGLTERSYMTVFDDLTEVYTVGSTSEEPAAIVNVCELDENTDYSLVFWLKEEEGNALNSVCQLQITFSNGDFSDEEREDKSIYKLNKNYIKPVKFYRGWKMFCIPFNTEDKKYAEFKFVVANAEALIMKADVEAKASEAEETNTAEDIKDKAIDYAKKAAGSAKKLGEKAVELGKKYKEPAKELGEKGINGIKKGSEKIMNSEAFKKIEGKISNLFSSDSNKAEDDQENTKDQTGDAETDLIEAAEQVTVAEEQAAEVTEEVAEAAGEAAEEVSEAAAPADKEE